MSARHPTHFEGAAKPTGGNSLVAEPLVAEGFDVQKFVESFGVLAEAEGGIKKLRELVLDLAVRGALVSQLEDEGTSEALVAHLASARRKLSAKTRVRADLPAVRAEDELHPIPSAWCWVRLGHFGGFLGGGTPTKSNTALWNGRIPWVSPRDMKRPYIDDAEHHISQAAVEHSAVKLIPKPSLLFVVRGMILAHSFPVALTMRQVTINQDMKALVLAIPETGEYLLRACWAARSRVLQHVKRSSHGTCRLDAESVEELLIPLPPLAEQKRIVAKIDDLMKLCDDLGAKLRRADATAAKLVEAAVAEIVARVDQLRREPSLDPEQRRVTVTQPRFEGAFRVERADDGRIIIIWPSGHATGPWSEKDLHEIYDEDQVADIMRLLSESDDDEQVGD